MRSSSARKNLSLKRIASSTYGPYPLHARLWTRIVDAGSWQASEPSRELPVMVSPPCSHSCLNVWKMVSLFLFIIITAGTRDQGPQFTCSTLSALTSTSNQSDLLAESSLNEAQISASWHSTDHTRTKQLARLYVADMSLDEKLGQLLIVEYTTVPDLQIMISQHHVGGVIMYLHNISTAEQTKQDTAQMQQEANLPLFIAADQEGGNVNRLSHIYSSDSLSAKQMRLSGDPNLAYNEGKRIGQ